DAMKQIRHGSDTICHRLGFPTRSGGPCGASPLRPAFLTGTIYWFRPSMGSSGERLQFPTRFVEGWPSPLFTVNSKSSDKLPAFNWVGLPGL
ncbi:hypothetical protein HAX54_032968, partial [Datura stramonium]|nr:hypothetical protein [Datura stramonium]